VCGVVCAFDIKEDSTSLRYQILEMSKKIRHRGPDWSGIYSDENAILAHERLAVVDPISGNQPLVNNKKNLILSVNGEIYNHQDLKSNHCKDYDFKTQSDCEIILALYEKYDIDFIDMLNGIFAFALFDKEKNQFLIARDHIGIIPFYTGYNENGTFFVASELKALENYCNEISVFPPGHYMSSKDKKPMKWYKRKWISLEGTNKEKIKTDELKECLENAVHRQLMSDVPYGVLLSGGLDSSIIAAIASKYSKKRVETKDISPAWWPRLHSFSVGLESAPDLKAARKVAKHIDSVHHEIIYTIQEGLDAINDVIFSLETYDITTIRASTPMYLMARAIKSMGVKMVLSGEGADELFGGYLYFHMAPNEKEFHDETVRKLNRLHQYDCLRANKALAAWGVEARVPFLDKEFIDVAMAINPINKMIKDDRIEKQILRDAFCDYLPNDILHRQKEQFSDGVGYNWIDTLKDITNREVSDNLLENAKHRFPIQTPKTKEEYYYRNIFSKHFPSDSAALTVPSVPSIACSSEIAIEWDKSFYNQIDPSGRAIITVHEE
tara:strand:+ start:1744 stop:3402 length:1659 start_codon:yes stop_codon:yes gene_type:complete